MIYKNYLAFNYRNFRSWFKSTSVPYKEIKKQIISFTCRSSEEEVELWGYYADYDHVVLSQIFGIMINLPKNGGRLPHYNLR